ncbi:MULTISPECIES: beta-galactosidase [unclassified Streptomyces]|uniref:beta-galactosidase n=1 Tax=unclassified Streptomyces TaxID=2593676 RepID=UPI002E36BBE1|nr:beta-galactosidase [Streptomyces sp. NBC_01280]WSE12495.1 beta-galactosidase [Streptomyces sp. NBC_01397]
MAAACESLNIVAAFGRGPSSVDGCRASVTYRDKQVLIDGEPAMVLAGEIHYSRLKRTDWQSRLNRAREAGLNTIATYIPWTWHETADGAIDVTGRTRPERDLGAFLDLCRENGFHVIARPGPFTMAELKTGMAEGRSPSAHSATKLSWPSMAGRGARAPSPRARAGARSCAYDAGSSLSARADARHS